MLKRFLHSSIEMWQYSLMLFLPVVMISMLRRWRFLAPFGLLGVLAILFGACVVIAFASHSLNPTWEEINFVPWSSMPIFFGIVAYVYEGIGAVIDMQRAMRKPQHYLTQLWIAYAFLAVLFVVYGSVGYLAFGKDTQQISLLNLPNGALKTASIILVMIALFFTYPVQIFPVFAILENIMFNSKTPYLFWKVNSLRVLVVSISWLISISLANYFSYFLSLIGAVGCSLLAFIIPPAFYMKMFWPEMKWLSRLLCISLFTFGTIASVFSTVVTIIGFIKPDN
jgi:proton-coupled amino acid transporter